jgi:uroporphyrinogen-III synthase
MNGQRVAILESRLGEQLAELIVKNGGRPVRAPALAEVPDVDPGYIAKLIDDWQAQPVKAAIFQTGVGTHALFNATDALGLTAKFAALLDATRVVVRGPKPTAALRSRGVRIDLSANDPFTSAEVLRELDAVPLAGERVVVQRYGATNVTLENELKKRGATVIEIPTYRWSLPQDTRPLGELIAALGRHDIDAVVVTSAVQIQNLFSYAAGTGSAAELAAHLNATLVVSIGPVASAALGELGVNVGLEAKPPKLGPLIQLLNARLS